MWGQLAALACLATGLLAAPERSEAGLTCPRSQGLFSHPTDCHLFVHCDHDHPYVKECPANLHFNPTLMVCDWPENAGCTGGTPVDPPTPTEPPVVDVACDCECCLKPSVDDCTTYYICKDGKAYKEHCGAGLVFNPNIDNCDLPSNYKCDVPATTPKPVTTKAPTTPAPKPSTTTLKPIDYDCPTSNGLFPNPKDCHTFYHCSNGYAYLKDCPANLEFNPVLLVCDWPENAGCNGKSTVSPQPTPSIPTPTDFDCPTSNGLFPNPKDCHTFYHCSNGYSYLKDCPANLEFNPVLLVCDWPDNAGCSIKPTSPKPTTPKPTTPKPTPTTPASKFDCPSDGLFPNPEDCHTFYHCSNGYDYLKDCPANLEFNPVLLVCDWPENAGCNGKSTVSPQPTTSPKPATTTTTPPSFNCPTSNGLFPNPKDCHTFYHCSNGYPYLKDCPANLEFNPVLLVCDWPEKAGCNGKSTVPPQPTTSPKPMTTTSTPPIFDCPTSNGLFPNPKDCHTFYHCSNGYPYLKDCPANLEFNPVLLVCDWPENSGCNGKPTPSPAPTSEPLPVPTPNPEVICPNETCSCRVPDSTDCSKFYQCKDGEAYPDSCPAGLVFNPASEVCDYAGNVPGCKPTTPRPTTRPTTPAPKPSTSAAPGPEPFVCPTSNGLFPNPNDCHTFYHCSNGYPYLKDCPASLEFNPVLLVCDWPDNAGCNGKPTPSPAPTSEPLPVTTPNPDVICPNDTCACRLPDPENCQCFFKCDNGEAFGECCSPGLHFNKDTEVCDLPENVDCGPVTTPKPPKPEPTTQEPPSTTQAPSCTFACTKSDGFYGNPLNCETYFECSAGQANIHYCPSDKHFNTGTNSCDAPESAGCCEL